MAKINLRNIKKVEVKVSGLKMVKPPELSFKVDVQLDKKIEKEAGKDPLLLQEFHTAVDAVYQQTMTTIERKLKVFDGVFVQMVDKGASEKDMKKQLAGLNTAIKNDMKVAEKGAELAVMKAWTDLQAKRKEWRGFKVKVGVSIGGTLAGLAISIAAMIVSPFSGGAGAALGIIGLVKSGVSLASDIAKLAMTIDQSRTVLIKNLAVVEKAAAKPALNATNEVSAAVFQEFLGISQPSLKTCESAAETLKAKYAQMIVKVHDLSKTLDKILKQQDKLKKEFLKDAAKRLKKHPTNNKGAQLKKIEANFDKAMAKNASMVMTKITKISDMYGESRKWAQPIKELVARVKKLSLKDPKGLKIFREGLKFAALGLAPIDGNGLASGAKDLGLGLGGAIGGYAYDKISSLALDGTVFDAA